MWVPNRLITATIAVALLCAKAFLFAQASSGLGTRRVPPNAMPLSQLCDAPSGDGGLIVLSAKRLQWARPLPLGVTGNEIARLALAAPGQFVAVTTRWLALHDAVKGVLIRADCETGEVRTFEQSRPIMSLAASPFGDIAEQLEDGSTLIYPRQVSGYTGDEAPRIETSSGGPGIRVLVWSGRRLLLVGRSDIVTVNVAAQSISLPVSPLSGSLAADPIAAFVFNGITYVANGACLDLFVGTSLTPHLRRAACWRGSVAEDAVLLTTLGSVEVLNSDGISLAAIPRPSVGQARISGTTFEITASILSLLEHPAIPVVPVSGVGTAPQEIGSAEGWSRLLKPDYWYTRESFDRMLAGTKSRGWTDLRDEGPWSVGNGVAAAWRRGTSLVAPRGRSLEVLARLTDQQAFSDDQVRRIIEDNSELADTVEGVLIHDDWIPVGALFGEDTTMPRSFATLEALSPALKGSRRPGAALVREVLDPINVCRSITNTSSDKELAAIFQKGVPVAGAVDRGAEGQIVRASDVIIYECNGTMPLRMALLTDVRVAIQSGKSFRTARRAIVAVKGLPRNDLASLTRSWLDRLLRTRGLLPSLLLPTTSLELNFVVNPRTPLWELQRSGMQLASAEAAPAASRALTTETQRDVCAPIEEALKARLRDETLMNLAVEFEARRLKPPLKIGVVENAVPLTSPLFSRNGEPLWEEPKPAGGFGPIALPPATDPSTRPARFLRHGSQVAGMLVVARDDVVRGVLADAALVWIDAIDSPGNNTSLLDKLSTKKVIVNVSDRLDAVWDSLSTNNASWRGLLFIAAAKNVDENVDGPPLTWNERANVMGVGLVDRNGALMTGSKYDSRVVDLVAPGAGVPTVDEAETLACAEGTSYATAYVSAVSAMLANRAPRGWTVSQLRARLLSTADWKPEYLGKVKGGVVNADRALNNLDKNVLVIDRGNRPALNLEVVWDDSSEFDVSGLEKAPAPGVSRVTRRIQWSDVLRWQVTDNAGVKSLNVAFIHDEKFAALHDVAISSALVLPIRSCVNLATLQPVECKGLRASQIKEYTGALYSRSEPVSF
jgi:hypothetical protein